VTWDRTNRLELELAQAEAHIRTLTASLELARSVAVHATQVCAMCGGEIVEVTVVGDAR
jgi:hypothetical protein